MFCVFCVAKIFLKKFDFVLIAWFTMLLMCTPVNHPMENLFFQQFFHQFFTNFFISMRLFLSVRIFHDHLWEYFLFCENLFLSMVICENIFFFCENLFEPFLFVRIPSYLWSFVRIFENISLLFTTDVKISKCINTII